VVPKHASFRWKLSLERSTKACAQDRIDHPRHGHDDIADAVAGALVFATRARQAQQSFAGKSSELRMQPRDSQVTRDLIVALTSPMAQRTMAHASRLGSIGDVEIHTLEGIERLLCPDAVFLYRDLPNSSPLDQGNQL
jgi:hypothetical protein